jgi:hypothetical protein
MVRQSKVTEPECDQQWHNSRLYSTEFDTCETGVWLRGTLRTAKGSYCWKIIHRGTVLVCTQNDRKLLTEIGCNYS